MRPELYDNLHGQPQAFVDTVYAAVLASVEEHGHDPCTRAQTAAHEAGHVLVGYVYGETVNGARIWLSNGRWVGVNEREHEVYKRPEPTRMTDEPDWALRCAVMTMAGFVGEIAAKLEHPSSSIDERLKARAFSQIVSEAWGGTPQQVEAGVMVLCIRAIEANRLAFDVVRGQLQRTHRLTAAEAARMLHHVVRKQLPAGTRGPRQPAWPLEVAA